MKYIPVSGPGTLVIYQTLIWAMVSKWFLGDIVLTMVLLINVSLYCQISKWIVYVFNVYVFQNYSVNFARWGYQNTSIINLHAWDYGLLGVLNVTERNHWMTLNTAFIYSYNIH